ncbi:MAG TPA: hypothetical protein DHV26_00530 [Cytophagales bacterium]|mgnify:CR=1 FL=1|nr:hypothetical protein [Cytophagales bacterium]HRG08680.1 hypothetical protein [Cyclobacteriaceae bacterium]
MKNYTIVIFIALAFTACVASKTTSKAPAPTGSWDYTITGTPQGDFKGVMIITEVDKVLTAKLISDGAELPIDKFVFNKETLKMSGEFDYSGALILFDGLFATNEITGTMTTSGMSFPFKATRKN